MTVQQMGLGSRGDEFYEALIAVHDGLDEPASHALNARLVLILANRIGDVDVLKDLLKAAADA
ncbi:hypothetical protein AL036_09380 [Salipiger aestuarii]|uniref:Uncharacterized protein DUF2783 n=1 Tax=Salipiger aestuarii TaxID=568098 RepID=A0A327XZX1_9RHOB|nr:DUF2783 domain-containing protein [Salipiger aestuarii]EIE51303.1 hypothetical protein C357_09413 [Citreicella sp. 357]KAA8607833.1 hypothetical protein AL036_09380 [Salipiger aestuarii]KAA8610507.1 hypothetical protein AL037_13455 [Salipiger aestuarii]KAB2541087.1 hypothetical protein AL035_14025 [Salipiger aestuarii]RAK13336.1 uncharacterized protein DUF2783 [Salipiger aestuarii]